MLSIILSNTQKSGKLIGENYENNGEEEMEVTFEFDIHITF